MIDDIGPLKRVGFVIEQVPGRGVAVFDFPIRATKKKPLFNGFNNGGSRSLKGHSKEPVTQHSEANEDRVHSGERHGQHGTFGCGRVRA